LDLEPVFDFILMAIFKVHQDEVKDWFKVQMEKARKFQPLAVLNQKLKGLDVCGQIVNHTLMRL
jgi:hypothetical protein